MEALRDALVEWLVQTGVQLGGFGNVLSHVFFVPPLNTLLKQPRTLPVFILAEIAMIFISLCYHNVDMLEGLYGGMSLAQWNLSDHLTSQGSILLTSILFIRFRSPLAMNLYGLVAAGVFWVVLVFTDQFWVIGAFSAVHALVSLVQNGDRWRLAMRDPSLGLALGIALLSLGFFFAPMLLYYETHPFWHACASTAQYLILNTRAIFFNFFDEKAEAALRFMQEDHELDLRSYDPDRKKAGVFMWPAFYTSS